MSVVYFGLMVGCLVSGWLGDSMGRRSTILISYATVGFFSVLSAWSDSYDSLVFYRFFVGCGVGVGVPACNAMVGEICPSTMRINFACFMQLLFATGEFYAAFLIWCEDPKLKILNWRRLIITSSTPAFLFLILAYMFLMESPHFLAIRGRLKSAKSLLMGMADTNGAEMSGNDIVLVESSSESDSSTEDR